MDIFHGYLSFSELHIINYLDYLIELCRQMVLPFILAYTMQLDFCLWPTIQVIYGPLIFNCQALDHFYTYNLNGS